MNMEIKEPLTIAAVYLWIGFVTAISFMEAWLKFRAPGVTIPIGLGIGRLVFSALNKAEWVFALSVIAGGLISRQPVFTFDRLLFFIPLIILTLQSFWLLPALDQRAEMHLKGQDVPPSLLHVYYVVMEIIKVGCLFIFALKQFK